MRGRIVALIATFLFLVGLPLVLWGPMEQAYRDHYSDRPTMAQGQ